MAEGIGREAELLEVDRFLDAVATGPTSLEIEGEAGIGKTNLLRDALDVARARPYRVLMTAAVEAEAKLSFTGLTDLLATIGDAELAELPEPQRHALEAAILRVEPGEHPPDRRAIALALVSLLDTLSAASPVVVAVDDVRWLDRSTASALTFAARRLGTTRVGIITSSRTPEAAGAAPLGLDEALSPERRSRLTVAPLTTGTLFQVIQRALGVRLPRPLLLRVEARSNGNPFVALEIVRALVDSAEPLGPETTLPVPERIVDLARRRVAALSDDAREALLVVAAAGTPTLQLVNETAGAEVAAALDEAREHGVVTIEGQRVRFTHPLLATAAHDDADPARWRDVHRRLAELLPQAEERARHLALASEAPEPGIADALELAVDEAWSRGTPEGAAELAMQAVAFTPADDERRAARQLTAARLLTEAGDMASAARALEVLIDETSSRAARSEAGQALAELRRRSGDGAGAIELLERAIADASDDAVLQAQALRDLAMHHALVGALSEAEPRSQAATAVAARVGEPALVASTCVVRAVIDLFSGRDFDRDAMAWALDVTGGDDHGPFEYRVDTGYGTLLWVIDELDAGRALMEVASEDALRRGRLFNLGSVLTQLAFLELRAGNWDRCLQHADTAIEAAALVGTGIEEALGLWMRSFVCAHRGDVDAARADADAGIAAARAVGEWATAGACSQVLAFLELSLGDAAAADARLHPIMQVLLASEIRDPFVLWSAPDEIEALVTLGRLDDATALLDAYDERARATHRRSALAAAGRCRGLLLAARGDVAAGLDAAEAAVGIVVDLPMPFEQARALLVLGQLRRRNKERAAAQAALEGARELFEGLGAALWSAKAASEMDRLGIRRPGEGLTPTEAQTARLAAAGRTNREIADELFVSAKTVEANLSRVYVKLGIRRRAELAGRLAALEDPPSA